MPKASINVKKISPVALLIVDMVNDFQFEGGDEMFGHAFEAARAIAELKQVMAEKEWATVYVNDNCGEWQQDFDQQVKRIAKASEPGRKIIELLRPGREDHYILKPQRSGFFETPLAMLLEAFETHTVIVTGVAADICVLFTAHDAHMRGFKVAVPADCTAAIKQSHRDDTLKLLKRIAHVDVRPSAELIEDIRAGNL
jgi:nicotinamidase-related amidase